MNLFQLVPMREPFKAKANVIFYQPYTIQYTIHQYFAI